MPTSVRLDRATEALLDRLARERDASRSQIVREAIAAYGAEFIESGTEPTLYERLQDSVGKFPTGGLNLSVDSGEKFAALLREEYEADQAAARAGARKKPRKA